MMTTSLQNSCRHLQLAPTRHRNHLSNKRELKVPIPYRDLVPVICSILLEFRL